MEAPDFFLEQFDTVCRFFYELCLKGLSQEQLRYQPKEGLNWAAWLMWHCARSLDWANTLITPGRKRVLNQDWRARLNVQRRRYRNRNDTRGMRRIQSSSQA